MEDSFTFWSQHFPGDALDIVRGLLGAAYKGNCTGFLKAHHVCFVTYVQGFDHRAVERELRRDLDRVGWLYVTTGPIDRKGQVEAAFAIAPILPIKVEVGYHATRACMIKQIREEGLKPSNEERRATNFPDTEGVIHICAKLKEDGDKDSAEWWRDELSKKNRFGDPNWGILQIHMTGLPTDARVYQDIHSASGVVVDRIDKIPAHMLSEVS
jgi:hypothetical protein